MLLASAFRIQIYSATSAPAVMPDSWHIQAKPCNSIFRIFERLRKILHTLSRPPGENHQRGQPVRCGDSCGYLVNVRVKCTHCQTAMALREPTMQRTASSFPQNIYYTVHPRPWAPVGFSSWLEWRNVHTWSWLDQTRQGRGLLTSSKWRD